MPIVCGTSLAPSSSHLVGGVKRAELGYQSKREQRKACGAPRCSAGFYELCASLAGSALWQPLQDPSFLLASGETLHDLTVVPVPAGLWGLGYGLASLAASSCQAGV